MTLAVTAAVVGSTAALATAGVGIYDATQSGGGGGGGGGMGLSPLSPQSGYLNNLFGLPAGFPMGTPDNPALYPGMGLIPAGLFGPDTTAAIRQYETPLPLNQYQTKIPQGLLQQALGAEQGQGGPLAGILPFANQAATNPMAFLQPSIAAAERQFSTYGLPQIAEQYAGTTGVNSSSFAQGAQRSAADIATNIGAMAPQIQMQALPLASALTSANISIPTSLASDISQYGSGLYSAQTATQPGYRDLNLLAQLSGLAGGLQYTQPGFSPFGSGGAGTTAALSAAIPGITQGLSQLSTLFQRPADPSGIGGASGGGGLYPQSTSTGYSLDAQNLAFTGGGTGFGGGGGQGYAPTTGSYYNPYGGSGGMGSVSLFG